MSEISQGYPYPKTTKQWVTDQIKDHRETAPVQANDWSDVKKLDRLITIGMELANTGGNIVVMVPNADLCSTIINCIRVARKDSFWAFASQRVITVLYDVAAMAQAIEDARSKLPADALIVVRFFSHLGQPMKWPVFALSDAVRPVAFIGSGVIGHTGTQETHDTCLHKHSMIGKLQLSKWSPSDRNYRGIGFYALGTHQSAAQAALQYTSDFARFVVFFAAWPIVAGAAGLANYVWGGSATTKAVEGLRDRVIRQGDVLNLISLPAGSDFSNISAAKLLDLHNEASVYGGSETPSLPSYRTFEEVRKPSSAYRHSQSSSFAGTYDKIATRSTVSRIPSSITELPSVPTPQPRPIDPIHPIDRDDHQNGRKVPLRKRIKFLIRGHCKCVPGTCSCPMSW